MQPATVIDSSNPEYIPIIGDLGELEVRYVSPVEGPSLLERLSKPREVQLRLQGLRRRLHRSSFAFNNRSHD